MRLRPFSVVAVLVAAAASLILVAGASASTAPGALKCPLPVYNPTHWAIVAGATVTCTIEGATDVVGLTTVPVYIKSTPLGNQTVTGTVSGSTITFTFTSLANGCETSIVAYGTGGNNTNNSLITAGGKSAAGLGYTDAQGNHLNVCGTVPPADALTASKTVDGSFDRTYKWGIDKGVDTNEIDNAGSATFNYTVTVTHDGGTDGNWQASGKITVVNPNGGDAVVTVTDSIADPNATCPVTGGVNATIPASTSVDFPYTCTYSAAPSNSSELNTGTVTWSQQTLTDGAPLAAGSANGTATVDWSSVLPTIVDGSVTVTDTLGGTLGTVSHTAPSPTTFTYPITFDEDPSGTCTEHDNTATFTTDTSKTTDDASQSVTHCVGADLTASKDATPSFTRTYNWKIAKAVDKTKVTLLSGTATFNYTVTVDSATPAFTDSGWKVTGTITVNNPNDWEAITADVTDAVDNGGVCVVTGGSGVSVPASGSVQLGYTCTYASAPSPLAGTNTATATWDKAAANTPDGSATGTHGFDFNTTPTTEVNKTINVTDTYAGFLGTLTYGVDTLPASFKYSRTIPAPAIGCVDYPNTATIVETNQTASQKVTVCIAPSGALTMGFWQNKNGQKIISGGHATAGVCDAGTWLRTLAPFLDLSSTASCGAVATYVYNVIKLATCGGPTCNAMLKAQMLATALDVYFSDPALGGNKIDAPAPIGGFNVDLTKWSGAFGGNTCETVSWMLTYAAGQSNAGGSTWYGNVKATQVLAASAFDAINNEIAPSC